MEEGRGRRLALRLVPGYGLQLPRNGLIGIFIFGFLPRKLVSNMIWHVGAEQARNHLKHSGYDMAVFDFNMPGESGLDLLHYVSSIYPGTPFVLMTGYDDLRIKRESIRAGVQAYIQKLFYLNEPAYTINLIQRDNQKEVPAA